MPVGSRCDGERGKFKTRANCAGRVQEKPFCILSNGLTESAAVRRPNITVSRTRQTPTTGATQGASGERQRVDAISRLLPSALGAADLLDVVINDYSLETELVRAGNAGVLKDVYLKLHPCSGDKWDAAVGRPMLPRRRRSRSFSRRHGRARPYVRLCR